jgi:hypothetical protein
LIDFIELWKSPKSLPFKEWSPHGGVALPVTGASDVLFTVLGHDDKEMTLGYMFRDPEFHADVNKIREEAKFVLAKEVFANPEKHGGLAAPMVRRVKADLLARSGKKELDTEELAEAAQILGDAVMVRPGVLCTAQRREQGACSSTLGLRDVGASTTVCMHRLETAANRHTRRRQNIDRLFAEIAKADIMTRVYSQGQLIGNLNVFPDLIEEYVADPRLKPAWADFHPKRREGMQTDIRKRLDQIMGVTR